MPRVYTIEGLNSATGEHGRQAPVHFVVDETKVAIPFVQRIEFADDADEGEATVTSLVPNAFGQPTSELVTVTVAGSLVSGRP